MHPTPVFTLDANSVIIPPQRITPTVRHALAILQRDLTKVLGRMPVLASAFKGSALVLSYAAPDDELARRPEAFAIRFPADASNQLHIVGSDDLGLMYGVLHVSQTYLGVDPLWFWADLEPERRDTIQILRTEYVSPTPTVRYRGWFVNDETCFFGWKGYPPGEDLWQPVFETLLRLGGNMVIPGTDLPRDGRYWDLAAEMGLWCTHHHVEPLGADMFIRRFPDHEASYEQYPELFEALWREGILRQRDRKVIWVIGYRGQGDHPFWEDDPACNTPDKRGAIISQVIQRQYQTLLEYVDNPVCCTYIYGELTELYRNGHLRLPDGVIKIWSDNGYARMVSRRQWLENPRIPALPTAQDHGPHGLYFHVAFHDLQASNNLTMLPAPTLVRQELRQAFQAGATEYLLVNTGIIRPHLYLIDLVSQLWQSGDIDVDAHRHAFAHRLFPASAEAVAACYARYFDAPITTGSHEDEKAGEQFYYYGIRQLVATWLKGQITNGCIELTWATGAMTYAEQVEWFRQKCCAGEQQWNAVHAETLSVLQNLDGRERQFLEDNLLLSIRLHIAGCQSAVAFCKSYQAFLDNKLPLAFLYASQAIWAIQAGVEAMTNAEHGKWRNFYTTDWITNVRMTIYSLETLRRYIRALGDDHDFKAWSDRLIWHGKGDQKMRLKPLTDDELARALEQNDEQWNQSC